LEKNPASLSKIFDKAFTDLVAVVSANAHYKADLDAALKATILDADIDKMLHGS
jgi:hypothetical protein